MDFDGDPDHDVDTEIFKEIFTTVRYGNSMHFVGNSRSWTHKLLRNLFEGWDWDVELATCHMILLVIWIWIHEFFIRIFYRCNCNSSGSAAFADVCCVQMLLVIHLLYTLGSLNVYIGELLLYTLGSLNAD